MSKTVKIGDDVVGQVALGVMMLTWTPNPVPYDQAFEAIKAAVDAMPSGVKLFINSGEFYGQGFSATNLDLLAAFYEKYPECADKTFLSVKGGVNLTNLHPDGSEENLRRSVDNINKHLRGTKKLDLFESARVDPKVPIEESIGTLHKLIGEGKFAYIGMSEASSATLRKAHAVHPIAAVEIELSPWSYEDEAKEVIATAKELGIAVVGYSPLGKGFLTGQIKSRDDIPEGDMRLHLDRFTEEGFQHNFKIVEGLNKIAERKGISTAQLSLAWVASLGDHVIPIPGSSKKSRVLENLAAGSVNLTKEEFDEINQLVEGLNVHGLRYNQAMEGHLWG